MQPEMRFLLSIDASSPTTRPQDQLEMLWDCGIQFGCRTNPDGLSKGILANIHLILAPALECRNALPSLRCRHSDCRERCLGLGCFDRKNRLLGCIFTESGVFELNLVWSHHRFSKNPGRLCLSPNLNMRLLIGKAKKPKGLPPHSRIFGAEIVCDGFGSRPPDVVLVEVETTQVRGRCGLYLLRGSSD